MSAQEFYANCTVEQIQIEVSDLSKEVEGRRMRNLPNDRDELLALADHLMADLKYQEGLVDDEEPVDYSERPAETPMQAALRNSGLR